MSNKWCADSVESLPFLHGFPVDWMHQSSWVRNQGRSQTKSYSGRLTLGPSARWAVGCRVCRGLAQGRTWSAVWCKVLKKHNGENTALHHVFIVFLEKSSHIWKMCQMCDVDRLWSPCITYSVPQRTGGTRRGRRRARRGARRGAGGAAVEGWRCVTRKWRQDAPIALVQLKVKTSTTLRALLHIMLSKHGLYFWK